MRRCPPQRQETYISSASVSPEQIGLLRLTDTWMTPSLLFFLFLFFEALDLNCRLSLWQTPWWFGLLENVSRVSTGVLVIEWRVETCFWAECPFNGIENESICVDFSEVGCFDSKSSHLKFPVLLFASSFFPSPWLHLVSATSLLPEIERSNTFNFACALDEKVLLKKKKRKKKNSRGQKKAH